MFVCIQLRLTYRGFLNQLLFRMVPYPYTNSYSTNINTGSYGNNRGMNGNVISSSNNNPLSPQSSTPYKGNNVSGTAPRRSYFGPVIPSPKKQPQSSKSLNYQNPSIDKGLFPEVSQDVPSQSTPPIQQPLFQSAPPSFKEVTHLPAPPSLKEVSYLVPQPVYQSPYGVPQQVQQPQPAYAVPPQSQPTYPVPQQVQQPQPAYAVPPQPQPTYPVPPQLQPQPTFPVAQPIYAVPQPQPTYPVPQPQQPQPTYPVPQQHQPKYPVAQPICRPAEQQHEPTYQDYQQQAAYDLPQPSHQPPQQMQPSCTAPQPAAPQIHQSPISPSNQSCPSPKQPQPSEPSHELHPSFLPDHDRILQESLRDLGIGVKKHPSATSQNNCSKPTCSKGSHHLFKVPDHPSKDDPRYCAIRAVRDYYRGNISELRNYKSLLEALFSAMAIAYPRDYYFSIVQLADGKLSDVDGLNVLSYRYVEVQFEL